MNTDAEFPDTLVVSRIVFDDPRFAGEQVWQLGDDAPLVSACSRSISSRGPRRCNTHMLVESRRCQLQTASKKLGRDRVRPGGRYAHSSQGCPTP